MVWFDRGRVDGGGGGQVVVGYQGDGVMVVEILVVDGGVVGWCGAGNSIARAAGTSRKTTAPCIFCFSLSLLLCVCLGFCFVCFVSFCFVLFCCIIICVVYLICLLITVHSYFELFQKTLIPKGFFSQNKRFHMSDSIC